MAGSTASFPSLYQRAEDFREFLYHMTENAVTVEVKDGQAIASVGGEKNTVIDTFTSEADAAVYAMNGYHLIIDTRDEATTYNDFTLTYVLNGKKYSAAEWQKLEETEKNNYSVKVTYSSDSLKLTKEKMSAYVTWLLGEDCTDEEAKLRCRSLLDASGELPPEKYNEAFELYASAFYSDLSKIERYGKVPTMRSYYLNTYLATDAHGNLKYDNFVVILQNIYFCYFTTDSGVSVSTTGYFKDVADSIADSPKTVDALFASMHTASSGIVSVNYYLYLMRVAMFALIVWLITALLVSVCGWIGKCETLKAYSSAFKSFSSFWLFSGFAAAVSAFIGSFFLSRTANFWLGSGLFIGLSVIRCIEQNIYTFIQQKRLKGEEE